MTTNVMLQYELPADEYHALDAAREEVDRLGVQLRDARERRAKLVRAALGRHVHHYGGMSAVARASGLTKTGVQKIAQRPAKS